MVSTDKQHKKMAERNKDWFYAHIGVDYPGSTDAYMGGTAFEFLGLARPNQQNYKRLHSWYEKHELMDVLPAWLDETANILISLPGDARHS